MKKMFLALFCLASLSVFSQTIDEIIQNYSINFGGEKNMLSLTSIIMEGTYKTRGIDAPMTVTILNDKLYHKEYTIKGQRHYYTITANQGGYYLPSEGIKEFTEYSPEEIEMQRVKTYLLGDIFYAKNKHKPCVYEGTQDIEGISYHVLSVMNGIPPTTKKIYLNGQNFFMEKETILSINNQGQETEEATYYSDYQKTPEGYIFPMKIKDSKGEFIIKTIKTNPKVDPLKLNLKYPVK